MARLKKGDRVIIAFSSRDHSRGNPTRALNGQEHVVSGVRDLTFGNTGTVRGTEYYLEGVVSPYGMPCAFIDEQLVKI